MDQQDHRAQPALRGSKVCGGVREVLDLLDPRGPREWPALPADSVRQARRGPLESQVARVPVVLKGRQARRGLPARKEFQV